MKFFTAFFVVSSLLFAIEVNSAYIPYEVDGDILFMEIPPELMEHYGHTFNPERIYTDEGMLITLSTNDEVVTVDIPVQTVDKLPLPAKAPVAKPDGSITAFISEMAAKYGINGNRFLATLKCESGLKSIQSRIPKKGGPNGREDSWGIAQINLPSHPTVTRAEAMDPYFAIEWAAKHFSMGHASMWSCFRDLF